MTPGTTPETVDGLSRAKIDRLIDDLRHERFRWTPVRRVHIPKKRGTRRPQGLPTWTDKLRQEVMRSLLEADFEPQFSAHSHGFRPGRGCHTAAGRGRSGVSKGRAKGASTTSTMRAWCECSASRSTITASWGASGDCCRPDTWRTGGRGRHGAARRQAALARPSSPPAM